MVKPITNATLSWQLDPEQDLVDLPEIVQRFHSLFPLEDVNREDEIPSTSFGVRTMIFKGVSSSDGQAYAIRRIDSRQVITSHSENYNLNLSGFNSCMKALRVASRMSFQLHNRSIVFQCLSSPIVRNSSFFHDIHSFSCAHCVGNTHSGAGNDSN